MNYETLSESELDAKIIQDWEYLSDNEKSILTSIGIHPENQNHQKQKKKNGDIIPIPI